MPSHPATARAAPVRRRAAPAPIPARALLVATPFGELSAEQVQAAIARGLAAAGAPVPDALAVGVAQPAAPELAELLSQSDFDARMRASRAVVIAVERLSEATLAGSVAFELATRARQAGVPAYAVTAHNELDSFDARILDLQCVIEADGRRALAGAGRRLARVL